MSARITALGIISALGLWACQPNTPQAAGPAATATQPSTTDSVYYDFPTDAEGHILLDWKDLAKVEYEERYYEAGDTYVAYPVFPPAIRSLDGKKVKIKGYVIPISESGASDPVLSAYPFSNCFFCGNAGLESVLDLFLENPGQRFGNDELLSFVGLMQLNDSNPDYLIYGLKQARPLPEGN